AIEAMAQGNGVVQSPPFDTNVRPLGVGSVTVTPVAVTALLLLIAIWKVTSDDGSAVGKPLFTISRSTLPPVACGVTTVDALFAPLPSFVEPLTDAVLVMEPV